jgi:hypothetical protein
MSDMEIVALTMLGAASELYNDAEILRDAIDGDEHDKFSADYIDAERDVMLESAKRLNDTVDRLLTCFGIEVE